MWILLVDKLAHALLSYTHFRASMEAPTKVYFKSGTSMYSLSEARTQDGHFMSLAPLLNRSPNRIFLEIGKTFALSIWNSFWVWAFHVFGASPHSKQHPHLTDAQPLSFYCTSCWRSAPPILHVLSLLQQRAKILSVKQNKEQPHI